MDNPIFNAVSIASDPNKIKYFERDKRKELEELRKILLGLTSNQVRFIEYYIRTASASQAAKLAGSTAKNPDQQGYLWLKDERIQKAIAIALRARIEAVGLDTTEVIMKLREVYEASMEAKNFNAANRACELMLKELERASLVSSNSSNKKFPTKYESLGEPATEEDLAQVLSIVSRANKTPEKSKEDTDAIN